MSSNRPYVPPGSSYFEQHKKHTKNYAFPNFDCAGSKTSPTEAKVDHFVDPLFMKCIIALIRKNSAWIDMFENQNFLRGLVAARVAIQENNLIKNSMCAISFHYNIEFYFSNNNFAFTDKNLLSQMTTALLHVFIKYYPNEVSKAITPDYKMDYLRSFFQEFVQNDSIDIKIWNLFDKTIIWKMRSTDFAGLMCLPTTSVRTMTAYLEALCNLCTKFEKLTDFLQHLFDSLAADKIGSPRTNEQNSSNISERKAEIVAQFLNLEPVQNIIRQRQQQKNKIDTIFERMDYMDDLDDNLEEDLEEIE
jgi:hypothetical protein